MKGEGNTGVMQAHHSVVTFWSHVHTSYYPGQKIETIALCAHDASMLSSSLDCSGSVREHARIMCAERLFRFLSRVLVHMKLPPTSAILLTELAGRPKWLPLIVGYHKVMHTPSPTLHWVCQLKSEHCTDMAKVFTSTTTWTKKKKERP